MLLLFNILKTLCKNKECQWCEICGSLTISCRNLYAYACCLFWLQALLKRKAARLEISKIRSLRVGNGECMPYPDNSLYIRRKLEWGPFIYEYNDPWDNLSEKEIIASGDWSAVSTRSMLHHFLEEA